MEIFQRRFALIVCALVVFAGSVYGWFDGRQLTVGYDSLYSGDDTVGFHAAMDAAGYSDGIWYGNTERHEHAYHELLCGEWGAAIYYDGINTTYTANPNDDPARRQAMWLTKEFKYPDWPTYCDFRFPDWAICAAEHDDLNPTPLMNKGQSTITNSDVRITIDYEVVDLGVLGAGYSPMAYVMDANSVMWDYVLSDRYVVLQTYTIRNLKSEVLTGLEFYQFLHSHGADEYGPQVSSTYTDVLLDDPLASYVPHNPVHQVGDFRYDITQWNERPYQIQANHVDYVGFSSVVAPDWIDNGVYEGHGSGKPNRGTHLHIEERMPNGESEIHRVEAGGAMGWSMGSLDPNETVSLTLAFMFGPEYEASDLELTVGDNTAGCVSPEDEFRYRIHWRNTGINDAQNVRLTAYLPAGVTYPEGFARLDPNMVVIPPDPAYSAQRHSYVWDIGTVLADSNGIVELTVVVNEQSDPGMSLRNDVRLSSSLGGRSAEGYTSVCCWDTGGIIYVDKAAKGYGNGIGWEHAYRNLQGALARALGGCGAEIWVAEGTYDPGRLGSASFVIPADVSVYGGFRGGETLREQRNPDRYKTILTGGADDERNETVVTMGNNAILDGFTITQSSTYGIYGKDAHFTIENCKVIDNPQWGIYAKDGDVIVRWCGIAGNGWHGVHHVGMGYSIAVEKTKVVDNQQHGILCEDSIPVIKNCVVFGNGYDEYGFSGINILRSSSTPTLYNNTVIGNRKEGISFVSPDPNYASGADYIDMQNCVVWYNNSGGSQVSGLNPDATAYYCCIQDCNDVPGRYNISVEPGFAYLTEPNNIPDPNNPYHLGWDSPCKDAGNPAFGELEVGLYDIDGEDRICYGRIDIGADEAYSCNGYSDDDIYNALDWNADGIVNFSEFAQISAAWGSRSPDDPTLPGDPNFVDPNDFTGWNGKCDFDSDYNIGLGDLAYFAYDGYWLWTACWKQAQMSRFDSIMSMMSGGESAPAVLAATTSIGLSGEPVSTETSLDPASIPTRELGSFVTGIREVIDQIETTITEGHENTENLLEMKVFLEDVLREIEAAAK